MPIFIKVFLLKLLISEIIFMFDSLDGFKLISKFIALG